MGEATTYLAFLRAVNVGGRRIEMGRLARVAERSGYGGARTFLNTGNLVLRAPGSDPDRVEQALEAGIRDEFEISTEVIVRDVATVESTLARNPFAEFAKRDPSHLLVVLLKDEPSRAAAAGFARGLAGPEEGRVVGAHAFVTYPAGIGTSKLTLPRIEAALGTRGTGRNWNTMRRLLVLAGEPVGSSKSGG